LPSRYKFCLGISQWLSNILLELPQGYPVTFGLFLAAFLYPFSIVQPLPNGLKKCPRSIRKMWQFPSFFSEALFYRKQLLKVEEAVEHF
jgi:hypothetical protein